MPTTNEPDLKDGQVENFIIAHLPAVKRMVKRRLRGSCTDDVEEVVQRTIFLIWKCWPQCKQESTRRAWALTITMNQINSFWRRRNKNIAPLSQILIEELVADSTSPDRQLETASCLQLAMRQLSDKEQLILQWAWIEEQGIPLEMLTRLLGQTIFDSSILQRAVNGLPEPDKLILQWIRTEQGFPIAEFAGLLKVSEGSVRTNLCRALQRLRKNIRILSQEEHP